MLQLELWLWEFLGFLLWSQGLGSRFLALETERPSWLLEGPVLQDFPNKSLGLFLTDIFLEGFCPSVGREQLDLLIFQKFLIPSPLVTWRRVERWLVSLARPGTPALPGAGSHGRLQLLSPPLCPRLADGLLGVPTACPEPLQSPTASFC